MKKNRKELKKIRGRRALTRGVDVNAFDGAPGVSGAEDGRVVTARRREVAWEKGRVVTIEKGKILCLKKSIELW